MGNCGLCKKENVEGEKSEHLVDFICIECLDIIDKFNALDNVSFMIYKK